MNTVIENSVFLFLGGLPAALHDIKGLGKKSTDKWQTQDTNAADYLIKPNKCDHGKDKEKPIEPRAFFSVFHA